MRRGKNKMTVNKRALFFTHGLASGNNVTERIYKKVKKNKYKK